MSRPIDPERLAGELAKIVGEQRVSLRSTDLDTYARDMWPRLLLSVRAGTPLPHRPYAVVWPETVREVASVVKLARSLGVPIIPYGGGSGVCGGVVPVHGGITVDLKRMDRILGVDRDRRLCNVEAGMNGERFERELERRGFTFGNFPSSIYVSTVGGWVATRAAGQLSTKYGKVEDRVIGVTLITGTGEVVETDALARAQRGPNWSQLVTGSEGTLGVITSVRLRLSPAPELKVYRGYEFDSVPAGVEAIRRVLQRGLRPAVVRLYDDLDTLMHVFGNSDAGVPAVDPHTHAPAPTPGGGALPRVPRRRADDEQGGAVARAVSMLTSRGAKRRLGRTLRQEAMTAALSHPRVVGGLLGTVAERFTGKGCRLIVGLEGARIRTEVEARLVFGELERAGGRDQGEEPGRHWLEHRYDVSYKMSPTFRSGAFVDTMEVASTWERLLDMYDAVREAIGRYALVMAHFSHAYSEGCSIYFTFAGYGEDQREAERIYDAIWRDGLTATTRVGGTISHHHGVGMLKAAYMAGEHREAMSLLRALKATLDPDDILNPGKLGLAPGRTP